MTAERPRLLLLNYACDPHMGSEPGAGWGCTLAFAEVADCTVLVGPHHEAALRAWTVTHPDPRVTFLFPSESRLGSLARWSTRMHRQLWFLVYLDWLRQARRTAQALHARAPFDAAAHVSYGSYWLPSPVVDLGIPSVWGPVGGGVRTPRSLLPYLGWRGLIGEWEKRLSLAPATLLPSTRRTWRDATVHLVETDHTRRRMGSAGRSGARVAQRAVLSEIRTVPEAIPTDALVFPSSLQPRKGTRLALAALRHAPDARLLFANSGYEEQPLRRLARRYGVADRIRFLGKVSREELFALLRGSRGALFTGLREEGGCALVEAMLLGVPVVVLGHAGPRVITDEGTDPERMAVIGAGGAEATARALGEAMQRFTVAPVERRSPFIDPARTRSLLVEALWEALAPVRD